MDDDRISQAVEGIEQGLLEDDPAFVRRFQAVRRTEMCSVLSVFLLLAAGAVLLTVGVALSSWLAWGTGLVALVASAVVDEHHKHFLRRSP